MCLEYSLPFSTFVVRRKESNRASAVDRSTSTTTYPNLALTAFRWISRSYKHDPRLSPFSITRSTSSLSIPANRIRSRCEERRNNLCPLQRCNYYTADHNLNSKETDTYRYFSTISFSIDNYELCLSTFIFRSVQLEDNYIYTYILIGRTDRSASVHIAEIPRENRYYFSEWFHNLLNLSTGGCLGTICCVASRR